MSSSPKVSTSSPAPAPAPASSSSVTKMFHQVTGFLAKGAGYVAKGAGFVLKGAGFVVDGLIGTALAALEGFFRSVFDIVTFPFMLIEGIFKILTTNPVTTVKRSMGHTSTDRKKTIVKIVKKISMVALISLLMPSVVIGLDADIPNMGFNFVIGNISQVASVADEHRRNAQIIYDIVV